DNTILITRSGVCKGEVAEKDIAEIDLDGRLLSKNVKISTEHKIHLLAYQKRKEVNAVVHCHPAYATAFALIGKGLDKHFLPEVFLSLGKIPVCKYATPSTGQVPKSLEPYIKYSWAMLLQNHGAITLGKNLDDAYFKMEKTEHAAKIIWLAKLIGSPRVLSKKNINDILKIAENTYGIIPDKRNI
ncbi:MAG TPA: class II aldolase/adducin family protein, partial [Ignavibacteriaceae bacterium]